MSDPLAAYLDAARRERPARPPATLGEVWSAEWERAGLDTALGVGAPLSQAVEEATTAVEAAYGAPLEQLAARRGVVIERGDARTRKWFVQELAAAPDAPGGEALKPHADIGARARAIAADIERRAADTDGATYGVAGWATGMLAGMARAALDPVNVAAMAIPGGGSARAAWAAGGRASAGFLAREAGQAALGQLAQEPFVEPARGALGLDHGFSRALANIATAGVAGGALFGGARLGLAALFDRAGVALAHAPRGADGLPADPAAAALARVADAPDLHALARAAEADAVFAAADPTQAVAHGEALAAARGAMETGRPFEPPAAPIGREAAAGARLDAPSRIVTATGRELDVRNVVMEWRDLIVSHDAGGARNPAYPQELQPRERDRASARAWIDERAAGLVPEWLGPSAQADAGAPLIGPDRVVESGNGRALLIGRAYERFPDRAAAYRASLERMGFDVSGMERPVLARERVTPLTMEERVALGVEGNKAQTMRLSDAEQASADARFLDGSVMTHWKGGSLDAAQNAPFVRAFLDRVTTPEERNALIDAAGAVSAQGVRRVEAAMVSKGWAETAIARALFEDAAPTSRAIIGAMADTAPEAARLRAAVEAGRVPAAADPTPAIVEAWRLVERARGDGAKVRDVLDQIDLERGAVPEDVRAAARMFFADDGFVRAAGRERVGDRIAAALAGAYRAADGPDMFGYAPTAAALLDKAAHEGLPLDFSPAAPGKRPAGGDGGSPRAPAPPAGEAGPHPAQARGEAAAPPRLKPPEGAPDLTASRADIERALAAAPDTVIELPRPDGGVERVAARELLARVDRLKAAAAELDLCIKGGAP